MALTFGEAIRKVASDFITSITNRTLKDPEPIEHGDEEFLDALSFKAPKAGKDVTIADAKAGVQDVLKGNVSITSQHLENGRFLTYETSVWGVSTEVDFITGTIVYRWAFKPSFRNERYDVLIYRSEGNEFPDEDYYKHGDSKPFIHSHEKAGIATPESSPGKTYVHTAVLQDRRDGDALSPIRFTTKVYSMEDWKKLKDASQLIEEPVVEKKEPVKKPPLTPLEKARKDAKKREEYEAFHRESLKGIDKLAEEKNWSDERKIEEKDKAIARYEKLLRDAKLL